MDRSSQYNKRRTHYDGQLKIVLCGNSSVGKSNLLTRFADDKFEHSHIPTIGVDFRFHTCEISGLTIKLQIWDTAGQEKFRGITSNYFRGADAVIIVCDVTNPASVTDISRLWLKDVSEYAPNGSVVSILANKQDLLSSQPSFQNTLQKSEELASQKGALFFKTSAKTGDGVSQAFIQTAERILEISPLKDRRTSRFSRNISADVTRNQAKDNSAVDLRASFSGNTNNGLVSTTERGIKITEKTQKPTFYGMCCPM